MVAKDVCGKLAAFWKLNADKNLFAVCLRRGGGSGAVLRSNIMYLKLNLDGITLRFQIRDYAPMQESSGDKQWIYADFSFSALPQLSYQRLNDELFQAYEVAGLATALEQLLDGEAAEDYEMICVEPDFTFAFHPVQNGKYETIDSSMDWTVGYWDGDVLEPNSISVRLGRLEIEQMLIYLKLSMGTLNAADPEVQRCMECHAICA